MLKRYIGSVPEVSVTIDGTGFTLKTGESVPVPDEFAASRSWPEENWEDVSTKAAPAPKPDTNDDEDKAAE